jgi:hypothetical protein
MLLGSKPLVAAYQLDPMPQRRWICVRSSAGLRVR